MRRHATFFLISALAAGSAVTPGAMAQTVTYQQSSVDNQQSLTGDVLASGSLNVTVVDEEASSTATGTGNGYSAQTQSGSLDVKSNQWVDADVKATNTVNVQDYAGHANMVTAATGNTGTIDSLNYGDVTGSVSQAVNTGRQIGSTANFTASTAEIGGADVGSQAIANSQGYALVGGSSDAKIDQWSGAITQAETTADFKYTDGTANFSASAISNNATIVGVNGADQTFDIKQVMTGDRTQASVLVGAANAQELNGTATAIANNVSASNEYNPLNPTSDQYNGGYVRAESDLYAYDFGAATSSAYGVGNSVVAGNRGVDLNMDVNQDNRGQVDAYAKFEGDGGYDAYSSSVAMGNAATGYACSTCQSKINILNRQSSGGPVTASSIINVTGSNRSVTGVASAIGNSATYYVSEPGG